MLISKIREGINTRLAGERLTIRECIPYLDSVMDDINQKLNTIYPVFSELDDGTLEYQYFPDRYIRTVLLPGAAYYYYQADEEGVNNSQGYQQDYNDALFMMLRDFSHAVPEEYQDNDENGMVVHRSDGAFDPIGLHDGGFGEVLP